MLFSMVAFIAAGFKTPHDILVAFRQSVGISAKPASN
jgi:hypothetical protein